MVLKHNLLTVLLCCFILSGCQSASKPRNTTSALSTMLAPSSSKASTSLETSSLSSDDTSNSPEPPKLFRGNDQLIQVPQAQDPIQFFGESVSLNFEEVPITQIVHVILGEILNLDYAIEHPLTGDVTLRTRTPIEQNQLLGILESLLDANGAVMVRDQNDRFFIGTGSSMSSLLPSVSSVDGRGVGFSNVVVPLRFIGAREMAEILSPIAPESAFVRIDSRRNLLMLSGTQQQIDGWLSMIATFDIDILKGMSVGVFPLAHAPVQEVFNGLVALLGEETVASSLSSEARRLVNVIPVERLNALLVVTPRSYYLDQVRVWIGKLDQPPDNFNEQQLFVYPVQNGSAAHLARLMSNLFSGSGQVSPPPDSGVAPRLTEIRSSSGESTSSNAPLAIESTNYQLDNNIKIVADEQSNALLIYARRSEFSKIEAALKKLDIAPVQVLIEASIIEVTLNDELRYGLEWFLQESLGGGLQGNALLNTSGSPIGPRQGFSFTVTNSSNVVRAALNALARDSLVNILSNPSVMVLDNHTATIQVGNQQPIRSSQTITDGGVRTNSIQYKDTGVRLEVTPSVNAGGMVNMNINQSVTDVGEVDEATEQRSFLERNITSRVAVRSGETVVLGGLIRDNTAQTRSGVPVLHDIPIVGNLFGTTANSTNRTELLVMITPRVLQNEQDLRDISHEIRSRMLGLRLNEESDAE